MSRKLTKIGLAFSLATSMATVATANEELSLQSLFDLTSSVASKMEQPIQDAPGVVTVFTKDDLKRLGYYTLGELADITPGYSSYTIFNEAVFETRGQKVASWANDKHLVLVDGIPVNNVKNNKAPTEYEIPVHMAKRVEFLKGPASALYGIGAFYGVVNVVPDVLDEEGSYTDIMLSTGNKDNKMRGMATILSKTDEAEGRVAFGYYRQDASQDPATNPWNVKNHEIFYKDAKTGVSNFSESASDAHFKDWDDNKSIFLNASYKLTDGLLEGLGAGLIYYNKEGGLGTFWMGPHSSEYNQLQWEVIIPYLKYEKEINDMVTVNSYVKFNRSRENAFAGGWNGDPAVTSSSNGGNNYVKYPQECPENSTCTNVDSLSFLEINKDGDSIMHKTDKYGYYEVDENGEYYVAGETFGASMWDHKVHNWEFLAETHLSLTETMGLIIGGNIDRRTFLGGEDGSVAYYVISDNRTSFSPFRYDDGTNKEISVSTYSGFMQLTEQFDFLEGAYITLGLREDYTTDGEEGNGQLSPRAAIVQKVTDKLNLKAMFGTALRAPNISDYQLNSETRNTLKNDGGDLSQLKDLQAETIKSFEGGLTYTTDHIASSFSSFYNITSNPIEGIQVKNANGTQINAKGNGNGEFYAWGIEAELQYAVNTDLRFFANYAYAEAWREHPNLLANEKKVVDEQEHLDDVPTYKVNGGMTYVASMLPMPISTTVIGKYVDAFRMSPREEVDGVDLKEAPGPFLNIDLNFSLAVTDNFFIEFQARNVTDEKKDYPWNEHKGVYNSSYTPGEGRNFVGSLRAIF